MEYFHSKALTEMLAQIIFTNIILLSIDHEATSSVMYLVPKLFDLTTVAKYSYSQQL